jgi:hypothetical protein
MDPQRFRRIAGFCGLLGALLVLGCGEACADSGVRVLVQSSPLAGFRYHEAADLWDFLRVGDSLDLRREPENPHDANAVAVWWRGRKLGYVPRRENNALAWGIDQGERVGARISRLTAHPNPARRIEVEVYAE